MSSTIFDKKNVVLAGGAGFIGSHLADRLIKDNKVICIDNFISGQESNIDHLLSNPDFIFIRHDLVNPINLESFPELARFKIAEQGVQEIYNFACPTSTKYYENFLLETLFASSHVTKNLLDMAVKYKAKFFHASTSSIYGSPLEGQKYFEEAYWGFVDPIGPRACYNEGRRFAETVVSTYRKKYGLNLKIARIFNTYGPRMRPDSGRMIPDFITAALNNLGLQIYGDAKQISSYCYVDDVINGVVKLMESPETGPMNLGNPEIYTYEEIAKKIIGIVGASSKIENLEELPNIQKQGLPDISLAREKLNWFPLVKLDEGLRRAVEDIKAARVLTYKK